MKPKIFCKTKDTINRTKQQHTEKEKILIYSTTDIGLISKIYTCVLWLLVSYFWGLLIVGVGGILDSFACS